MPLFEYICQQCGHQFEELVLGTTSPRCPSCQGHKLEKLLSVFAVNHSGSEGQRNSGGPCGTCGDPRGPGACTLD
jgi:putative FmdB family regulatory protein